VSPSRLPEGSRGFLTPDARHRANPAERNPRARAPVSLYPEGCSASALPEVSALTSFTCAPVRLGFASRRALLRFVSARSLRALHSQPRSPPVSVHMSRRAWPARSPSPRGDPVAPLARLTFRTSTPQGRGVVVTPVVIDQCQQPTILFSKTGTHVSVHFASRIPTRRNGSRFTPYRASLGDHACLSRVLSSRAASTCVPSMLRRPTGPRQNTHFGRPKPSSAILRLPA